MKITPKIVIAIINVLIACQQPEPVDLPTLQSSMDSIASVKIDSAYKQIQAECDTARKYRLPVLVDSLLKALQ